MTGIQIKSIRCPNCKSKSSVVMITEFHLTEAQYFVTDGEFREDQAGSAEASIAGNLKATCECSHEWKIRGISRISELNAQEE